MSSEKGENAMPRLFTYIVRIDAGAAPNPFHGLCTLAICKPRIRRVAQEGDWVAGLGSKNAKSGDLSRRLVYAMRVEEVLTFQAYDQMAPQRWLHRIPNIKSADPIERLGDCIYDYSKGKPVQRRGVHGPSEIKTDLGGKNVLVSSDFYYFGNRAIPLPDDLLPICPHNHDDRSNANAPYFDQFVAWLRGLNLQCGRMYGQPDSFDDSSKAKSCGKC